MMEILTETVSVIWGMPMILALTACGVYFTIKLRVPQIRLLPKALRLLFTSSSEGKGISPFSALCTSLGAAAGTGNIIGVATAMYTGGTGALFWMCAVSLLMMAVQYAESFLAVKYATTDENGNRSGGPMVYIRSAFKGKGKAFSYVFAVAVALTASIGMGSFPQVASVKEGFSELFGISEYILAPCLAVLMGFLLFGGVKKISRAAAVIVPITALLYTMSCMGILFLNASKLPEAFTAIVKSAFCGRAACGGFAGATMVQAVQSGVSRGIFTNEAGLGSTPMAAAASSNENPCHQGLVSMTGTFFDTLIMCTLTGLVLTVTDTWHLSPIQAASIAFASAYGKVGAVIISISLVLLALATMLGWSFYGETCTSFLFGEQGRMIFRLFFCVAIFLGCFVSPDASWLIADILNVFMLVPNMVAVMLLSRQVTVERSR